MMSRCDRDKQKMALILWDIDGFVSFNNRYGQKEGDQFLRRVSDIIKKSLRDYDEAFRCGADEFCAVLLPADQSLSADVTNRVSHAVSEELFKGTKEYADKSFSISSGIVYYPSDHRLPEALLYAAGEALYKSQHK